MAKLTLDLHEIFNRGHDIDRALREAIEEAVRIKASRSSLAREAAN
jgi:hypothetical protein